MKRVRLPLVLGIVLIVAALALSGCCAIPLTSERGSAVQQATERAQQVEPEATVDDDDATPEAAPTATVAPAPEGEGQGGLEADRLQSVFETLYEQVSPSVVSINVASVVQSEGPFGQGGEQLVQGLGSGFVYDNQGHIVTNNHVVADAESVVVTFSDEVSVPAEVVATDPDSDLAVIRVDPESHELRPLPLADSSQVRVGQTVVALGNPFGLSGTMTTGIVSALERALPTGEGQTGASYTIPDLIQTDAAINPGNSGGPLIDLSGRVIGVNFAIESPTRSNSGIGFAIPANIVRKVVPALIQNGFFEHPYLGVSTLTLGRAVNEALEVPLEQRGVMIVTVTPDSPAEEAGLQGAQRAVEINGQELPAGGDIIVGIDDAAVDSYDDLVTYLVRETEVGDTVVLRVIRDGDEQQVEVTLQARPSRG